MPRKIEEHKKAHRACRPIIGMVAKRVQACNWTSCAKDTLASCSNSPSSLQELDDWLQRTLAGNSLNAVERKAAFADWLKAPQARYSHPREEHLLPAHVVLGAARNERANVIFEGHLFGAAISSYQWD